MLSTLAYRDDTPLMLTRFRKVFQVHLHSGKTRGSGGQLEPYLWSLHTLTLYYVRSWFRMCRDISIESALKTFSRDLGLPSGRCYFKNFKRILAYVVFGAVQLSLRVYISGGIEFETVMECVKTRSWVRSWVCLRHGHQVARPQGLLLC